MNITGSLSRSWTAESHLPNQIPIEGKPDEVVKAAELRNEWFSLEYNPSVKARRLMACFLLF
jgi:hypothetical protein